MKHTPIHPHLPRIIPACQSYPLPRVSAAPFQQSNPPPFISPSHTTPLSHTAHIHATHSAVFTQPHRPCRRPEGHPAGQAVDPVRSRVLRPLQQIPRAMQRLRLHLRNRAVRALRADPDIHPHSRYGSLSHRFGPFLAAFGPFLADATTGHTRRTPFTDSS